jgi:NitT/TauT family transport system permease protein
MKNGRTRKFLLAILGFLIILLAWQSLIWFFDLPAFLVPAPAKVLKRGLELGVNWWPHLWASMYSTVLGFLLAMGAGFSLGTLIVHSRIVSAIITPPLLLLQIVPKMALAPIILVWVGIGLASRTTVVVLVTFFPIVISTIAGLQSIEPEAIDLARSLQMGRWNILKKIRFPNALPHIFSGLRVASTLAVIGTVISEFVASQSGLGYIILSAGFVLDTALQFAALALITIFGAAFYGLVVLAERLAMPWYVSDVKLVEVMT